jgi:hypothetical protein
MKTIMPSNEESMFVLLGMSFVEVPKAEPGLRLMRNSVLPVWQALTSHIDRDVVAVSYGDGWNNERVTFWFRAYKIRKERNETTKLHESAWLPISTDGQSVMIGHGDPHGWMKVDEVVSDLALLEQSLKPRVNAILSEVS